MAINRISGRMLQTDLQRDNDLSIQGDLIYFDIGNARVGIGTTTPSSDLAVVGNISVENITISSSGISSSDKIVINPTGNIDVSGININNLADPIANSDAATKRYVENLVSDATFAVSDGVTNTVIENSDTIVIQGAVDQIETTLNDSTFTIGLTDDVSIAGNLTVNDRLFVDGIDIGNNISVGGNLILPGEIIANSIVANSSVILPYLNDNALVFTNSDSKLVTYIDVRYDGGNTINVSNVAFTVDNITISGDSVASDGNLNLFSDTGQSVIVSNLKVANNTTPTLVCFIDANGHVTTDNNFFFDDSTLTVNGTISSDVLTTDNVTISNNQISSDGNLIISAESDSFVSIDNNTGIIVPVGTTAERPTNAEAGTVRWNSDVNYLEVFDGVTWEALGTDVTFITSQIIEGDDSTTVFTLDQEATTSGILVYINGVAQVPGSSYAVSQDQLTFVEAPQSQDTVEIRFISLSQTVSALTDVSGETAIRVEGDNEITFTVEGTEIGNISNSSVSFSSSTPVSVGNQQLGFLDQPQRIVAGNTALIESDRGGHLYVNSSGSYDIEIPNQSTVAFPIGTRVDIISHIADSISISPVSGVDLFLAGNSTPSSRSVGSFGFASLVKVDADVWSISGTSIT